MDYTNAILKVKSVNYIVASNVTEENWNDVKSSLYYLNNNEYVAVDSSAVYDSTIDYYIKSNWLQLPAIKGTSAHIAASPTQTEIDSKTINGQVITITNEDPLVSDSQFIIWNGTPGDGQVNAVDGVSPAQGTHNLVLQAVRYSDNWSITAAQKSQARENIDALSAGLKINNVSVSGLFTGNESITLTPDHIKAVNSKLTINDKTITNPTGDNASITLTASDIGAAQAVLENLKINDKSIVNLSTTPSINLTSGDLGISYDSLLNEASGNAVQNSTLYNKFNEISTSITGIANRVTNIEGKTNQNYNRIVSATLASNSWVYNNVSKSYIQGIIVENITDKTKVDINPDAAVINQMLNNNTIGIYVENYLIINENESTTPSLRVHAIGTAPTSNLTVQLVLNETT